MTTLVITAASASVSYGQWSRPPVTDWQFITTKSKEIRAVLGQGLEQVAWWVGKWGPSCMSLEDILATAACIESSMLHSFGYIEAALLASCSLLVSYNIMLIHLFASSKGNENQPFIFLLILDLTPFICFTGWHYLTQGKMGLLYSKPQIILSTSILYYYYYALCQLLNPQINTYIKSLLWESILKRAMKAHKER